MSVQVKGSGTIGGLDEGLVVSGIVTSSTEINVGSNIKIGSAGVVTATTFSGSGASLTNLPAANLTGTLPAISGANLTGITQTTINNNANNRVITGSGTANTLEGEANLTYDGTDLTVTGSNTKIIVDSRGSNGDQAHIQLLAKDGSGNNNFGELEYDGDGDFSIASRGSGSANNSIVFKTTSSNVERLRITAAGVLEMSQSGTNTNVLANDTGGPNIWLKNTSNTDGNYSKIGFFNSTGYITAFMAAQYQDAGDRNTDLVFGTRVNGGNLLERLRITSGGLMGVGTGSPAKNLHVYASGVATLRIETGDSRGQAWDLLSTNGAGSNTGTLSFRNEAGSSYLDLSANGGSPKTTFRNGGANDLLVVDNNGNVTKPRNAFAIVYTNSGDAGVSNNKIKDAYAVFTGVHLNQGSHYNTSNGRFTCPVAGVYGIAFSSNLHMSNFSISNAINIQTRRNGSIVLYNYNTVVTTIWQQMTFTNYVNCNANDYLQIYFGGSQPFGADQGSGLWGHLYFWLVQ